jgi:hypothetical protein
MNLGDPPPPPGGESPIFADTLGARGSELEQDFAFGVVRQLFEPALASAGMFAYGRARAIQRPPGTAR